MSTLSEFLSLKEDCTGLCVSTLVKMPHYWKSYALAQMLKLMGKKIFTILCSKIAHLDLWVNYMKSMKKFPGGKELTGFVQA